MLFLANFSPHNSGCMLEATPLYGRVGARLLGWCAQMPIKVCLIRTMGKKWSKVNNYVCPMRDIAIKCPESSRSGWRSALPPPPGGLPWHPHLLGFKSFIWNVLRSSFLKYGAIFLAFSYGKLCTFRGVNFNFISLGLVNDVLQGGIQNSFWLILNNNLTSPFLFGCWSDPVIAFIPFNCIFQWTYQEYQIFISQKTTYNPTSSLNPFDFLIRFFFLRIENFFRVAQSYFYNWFYYFRQELRSCFLAQKY